MGWYDYSSDDDKKIPGLPKQKVIHSPIVSFPSVEWFEKRHRIGTKKEFLFDKWELEEFNDEDNKFKVFVVSEAISKAYDEPKAKRPKTQAFENPTMWWLMVAPRKNDSKLPKEGETCHVIFEDLRLKVLATRVDNPCVQWGIENKYWIDCMTFTIALSAHLSNKLIAGKPPWYWKKPFFLEEAIFQLRISTSTRDAELGALKSLLEAREEETVGWESRVTAFEYLMTFQGKATWSLFDVFPHLPKSLNGPSETSPPSKLQQRLRNFDDMQRAAWEVCLANCHDRVCFVPGGPGAGKTFWNLTLAAALQQKVLYLLDINFPLTDVSNKMMQLHKDLYKDTNEWTPWAVVRMFCWSWEKKSSSWGLIQTQQQELADRLRRKAAGKKPDTNHGPLSRFDKKKDTSKELEFHGFQKTFRRTQLTSLQNTKGEMQSQAPTLDEAAAAYYHAHMYTKYKEITDLLSVDNIDLLDLKGFLVDQLYQDTLKEAKFIATTPVTASKFAEAVVKPAVVIFDEAPHARELSILIAIAKFTPKAWIFTGDHHQTKPYVGSYGRRPAVNQYAAQLRMSTMERFCRLRPDIKGLLVNHRAYGGLHALASRLFYKGEMVSGPSNGSDAKLPASCLHIRKTYIMPLKRNLGARVSRLLVVLKDAGDPSQMQSSWHHTGHRTWVMDLVRKLTQDTGFRQINSKDRGSILIMSPYARARIEYSKEIEVMRRTPRGLGGCAVEARSVDTAQGHEADFTILDFVRDKSTKHLEDPNRLCVGITRARQAEIIIMHEDMVTELEYNLRFEHQEDLAELIAECKRTGQYVFDPRNI